VCSCLTEQVLPRKRGDCVALRAFVTGPRSQLASSCSDVAIGFGLLAVRVDLIKTEDAAGTSWCRFNGSRRKQPSSAPDDGVDREAIFLEQHLRRRRRAEGGSFAAAPRTAPSSASIHSARRCVAAQSIGCSNDETHF
jgi:hypothetical protein